MPKKTNSLRAAPSKIIASPVAPSNASNGVSSTAKRRERERGARQQLILDAAKSVFAERGFLNTTVEEIAARAEVAVGTLYRYFQSKEELYVSLLFEAMNIFDQRITAIQQRAAPPDAQLHAVWDFFYEFYQSQPEYYRAFMFLHHEGLSDLISPAVITQINRYAGRNFRQVGQIIQAGINVEIFRPVDARAVVDMMWALLMGLAQLTETRRNLGVTSGSSLETLHQQAFEWVECSLRR